MNQTDIAIYAENLTKEYRLGVIGSTTLRAELQTKLAKLRGKEDPNSRVGMKGRIKGDIISAVDDVSFTIKKGERVGIIGLNGSGKTTLLKLICRITAPTKGYIGYNGRVSSMLEVGTGFHPELTGRENIYLSGSILGMSKEEIDESFDRIVEFAEVGPFIDTPVKRYSSGMYVRLGFAISAHLNADIVIMDEVLAVGDVEFQEKCIKRMREIGEEENKTVLYVSHNMFTVEELCSRCIVMDEGRIIYDGDVRTAMDIYRKGNSIDGQDELGERNRRFIEYSKIKMTEASCRQDAFNICDELTVNLKWKYEEDARDVHLRMEVRNDAGDPVGGKVFYDVTSGKAGDVGEADFELDTSRLRNGRYKLIIVMFNMGETGESSIVDIVEDLYFEVNDPGRKEKLKWLQSWWGSMRL